MDIAERTNQYLQQLQNLLDVAELDESLLKDSPEKESLQNSRALIEELKNAFTHVIDTVEETDGPS